MRDRHLPAASGPRFRISSLRAVAIVACMAAAVPGAAVRAQTADAPADAASSTAVAAPAERQPEALAALTKMGDYLRSLARFEVEATSATDAVLDNGQTVSFAHRTGLKVQRPNRLRAPTWASKKGPHMPAQCPALPTMPAMNKARISGAFCWIAVWQCAARMVSAFKYPSLQTMLLHPASQHVDSGQCLAGA